MLRMGMGKYIGNNNRGFSLYGQIFPLNYIEKQVKNFSRTDHSILHINKSLIRTTIIYFCNAWSLTFNFIFLVVVVGQRLWPRMRRRSQEKAEEIRFGSSENRPDSFAEVIFQRGSTPLRFGMSRRQISGRAQEFAERFGPTEGNGDHWRRLSYATSRVQTLSCPFTFREVSSLFCLFTVALKS